MGCGVWGSGWWKVNSGWVSGGDREGERGWGYVYYRFSSSGIGIVILLAQPSRSQLPNLATPEAGSSH
jgi:hypothetical protein